MLCSGFVLEQSEVTSSFKEHIDKLKSGNQISNFVLMQSNIQHFINYNVCYFRFVVSDQTQISTLVAMK